MVLRGGNGAPRSMFEIIHEFDNLGGKPNETNDILINLRFDFYWIALSASLATADDRDRGGNTTVSFGLWDPNKSDLLSPLDRFLGAGSGCRG